MSHTLEGDQPGVEFLGFHIRQRRVGKHQSGKGPGGHYRLGFKTLIQPAKTNVTEHLAELGRIMRDARAWSQVALVQKLNPKIRGWANYYRTVMSKATFSRLDALVWVKLRHWANRRRTVMSKATFSRLDALVWVKLRHWANRRHPDASPGWVYNRYWTRQKARWVCATPATSRDQASLTSHSQVSFRQYIKVAGNRSPYEGDWVYWSARQGRYPMVSPRLAILLKRQNGRCAWCRQYFQQEDPLEVDHIDGDRKNSRSLNLQVLHGHCHDAKTRDKGEYLSLGMRDRHQDTEGRREGKVSCSVLEQR